MPLGEVEHHPYVEIGNILGLGASKLILGSFPVFECTNPDNIIKETNRRAESTFRFFYGSNRNNFWSTYHQYVDNQLIQPWEAATLLQSLSLNRIAISDIILSCERVGYSSADNNLREVVWNSKVVRNLIHGGVDTVVCTSKWVLKQLEQRIISHPINGIGFTDNQLTMELQDEFITNIGGNINFIKNPVLKVFNINGSLVKAVALPSPGSPWRKLKTFGFDGGDWREYYQAYLTTAFLWLRE